MLELDTNIYAEIPPFLLSVHSMKRTNHSEEKNGCISDTTWPPHIYLIPFTLCANHRKIQAPGLPQGDAPAPAEPARVAGSPGGEMSRPLYILREMLGPFVVPLGEIQAPGMPLVDAPAPVDPAGDAGILGGPHWDVQALGQPQGDDHCIDFKKRDGIRFKGTHYFMGRYMGPPWIRKSYFKCDLNP